MSKPVVIVTGTSRGIGLSTTSVILKELGARVVAISRQSNDALVALTADHPEDLIVVLGDLTERSTSDRAVASAIDKFGRIDGLILNAGVLDPMGTIAVIPVDGSPSDATANEDSLCTPGSWKSMFEVNFFSLIHTIQATLPQLRTSKGRIIMVSSGAAVKGTYSWGPYNASKAAMNSLARTLATEEPDITTLALRPGTVDTNMQSVVRESSLLQAADRQFFINQKESGKLVKPENSGYVLGRLALSAKPSLSGEFVSWDSDACAEYRR